MDISKKINVFYKKYNNSLSCFSLIILSSLVRFIPFILNGSHPLGYDTGFYRRYLIQPFHSFFTSFLNTPVPGLGNDAIIPRIVLDILRYTHVPPDYILYGSYIFFISTIPCLIYLILKQRFNKYIGVIGGLFFIFSPIQYTGFWFMLWKNIFSLNLLLLAFYLFEKAQLKLNSKGTFIPILLLDLLIAGSHLTTSIIYIGTLLIFLLINWKQTREILLHIVIVALMLMSLHPQIYTTNVLSTSVGVFIEWYDYLTFSFPFFLLSLFAIKVISQNFKKSILFSFLVSTLAFPIFHLPFYERVFLFTDISLILTASIGFYNLLLGIINGRKQLGNNNHFKTNKLGNIKIYLFGAVLLVAISNLFGATTKQIRTLGPLIEGSKLKSIEALTLFNTGPVTIITSTDEAPWYEGFSQNHIIAPGMLNDVYNFEDWNDRWNSSSTKSLASFLKKFTHPLYISTFGTVDDILGVTPSCVEKINEITWRDDCQK